MPRAGRPRVGGRGLGDTGRDGLTGGPAGLGRPRRAHGRPRRARRGPGGLDRRPPVGRAPAEWGVRVGTGSGALGGPAFGSGTAGGSSPSPPARSRPVPSRRPRARPPRRCRPPRRPRGGPPRPRRPPPASPAAARGQHRRRRRPGVGGRGAPTAAGPPAAPARPPSCASRPPARCARARPRPPQVGHGSENASSSPCPTRLRVICTSPSEVTSATWCLVRSRPRHSVSRRSTRSRLDSSTMSMKSMTMMPPMSRSRSWRTISSAASRLFRVTVCSRLPP